MEELKSLPREYIEPLLSCFNLLKNCNIIIFDENISFLRRYFPYVYVLGCVFMYYMSLTIYFIGTFTHEVEIMELVYVASIYVICTQSIFKAWRVAFKKEKIKSVIIQLGKIWRTTDLSEKQIRDKNVLLHRLNFCYRVFYWLNILASWQYIMIPLFETVIRRCILHEEFGTLLPFACYFPFDYERNWCTYIMVYLFQIYSMFRIIYYYLGSEFIMITLCSHLSTQFVLLKEDLVNLEPDAGTNEICNDSDVYVVRNSYGMRDVIEMHKKLVCLCKDLDDIFNQVIFINLSAATITIGFFGFSAKVAHGTMDLIKNFVSVITLISPIFIVCYYAELLSESSKSIGDAAYNSPWYKGDKKYRKAIWFLIKRSQKPCNLTSLKMNEITLSTFTSVLRNTWSYFSLTSSLYNE